MSSSQDVYGEDFGAERMWGLKELAPPEPVGLWPLAGGWYVVAAILIVLLGFVFWRRYRAWKRNAYRRRGVALISAMSADPELLRQLPFLLRRTALLAHPRADVASLRGKEWIAWLNGVADRDVFSVSDASCFDAMVYQASFALPERPERQRLIDGARQWMKYHRAAV